MICIKYFFVYICLNSSIFRPLYKYECNNTSVKEIFFTNGDTVQRVMGIYNKKKSPIAMKRPSIISESTLFMWLHPGNMQIFVYISDP